MDVANHLVANVEVERFANIINAKHLVANVKEEVFVNTIVEDSNVGLVIPK